VVKKHIGKLQTETDRMTEPQTHRLTIRVIVTREPTGRQTYNQTDKHLNVSRWNLQCHSETVVVKALVKSNQRSVHSGLYQVVGKLFESDGLDPLYNSLVGPNQHIYTTTNSVEWTHQAVKLHCRVNPLPPRGFLTFFPKRLGIFNQFLHTYYTFISMLYYVN